MIRTRKIHTYFLPIFFGMWGIAPAYSAGADTSPQTRATPSRPPSAQDLIEATAPGYTTPPGMAQECLGRLVFDIKKQVEWPTWLDEYKGTSDFSRSFSTSVFHRGDVMRYGNTQVAVIGPLNSGIIDALNKELPANRIGGLQADIKSKQKYLIELQGKKSQDAKTRYAQSQSEDAIEGLKKTIKELQDNFQPFDSGVKDGKGYWFSRVEPGDDQYSVFHTFLIRDGYAYIFESTEKIASASDKEIHRRNFIKILETFRPRKTSEIPTELGVCIPHGFLPDDGKTTVNIKQSMRWNDAPGVLYTIHTGNVEPGHLKFPAIEAGASAAVGTLGSMEEARVQPFVTERIGPRAYKIGALNAQQGGVALNVKQPGKISYEAYSVFTGYSGWLGTAVLPYILVEMSTRTLDQAPELKQNPPPFKQSMGRLETLLKSMRLRPTLPLMPELAALPKD